MNFRSDASVIRDVTGALAHQMRRRHDLALRDQSLLQQRCGHVSALPKKEWAAPN